MSRSNRVKLAPGERWRWVALFAATAAFTAFAVPAARAATFEFPSLNSSVISSGGAPPGSVGNFWSQTRGDMIEESFLGPPRVDHLALALAAIQNTLSPDAAVDWAVSINGSEVGAFTITRSDGEGPIEFSASFPPITSPTYTVKLEVTNDVALAAGSVAFAASGERAHSLELSDEAPDTRLVGKPDAVTTESSASFSFEAAAPDLEGFQCSVDHTNFVPCRSPRTYAALATGTHSFEVSAVDSAGNADPTPATWIWTVVPPADTSPPATTITDGPEAITSATTASFAFAATELGASFECEIDGAGFEPCGRPKGYADLSPGAHTFSVRAIDQAGNAGRSVSWSWTITNPTPTSPPGASTSGQAPTTNRKSRCPKGRKLAKRHGLRACAKKQQRHKKRSRGHRRHRTR